MREPTSAAAMNHRQQEQESALCAVMCKVGLQSSPEVSQQEEQRRPSEQEAEQAPALEHWGAGWEKWPGLAWMRQALES